MLRQNKIHARCAQNREVVFDDSYTMSAEKLKKFEASEKKYYEKERGLDDTAEEILVSSPQSSPSSFSFPPLFSFSTTSGKREDREQEQDSREGQLTPAMGVSTPSLTKSLAFASPPYLRISSAGGGGSGEEERFSPLIETFFEVLSPRAWMKKNKEKERQRRRHRTRILPKILNNCKVVAVNICFAFPVSVMALLFSSAVVPIISAHAALTAILFLSLSVAFEMLEILIQSLHSMSDVQPYYREVSELALKSSMKEVKSYKRRVPLLFSTEKDNDNDSEEEEETKREQEGSSQTAP